MAGCQSCRLQVAALRKPTRKLILKVTNVPGLRLRGPAGEAEIEMALS